MAENSFVLTRRNFMAVGTAAVAAPIFGNMAGMTTVAKASERSENKYKFIDKKSCDLVVLGGGGSGLVAAVRAAQTTGKKVIVLEKAAATGGGGQFAVTNRTFGSKWQEKRNLPDTTVEYARDMMDQVYWRLDEKLVINCLRGTGQFFDWLCELGDNIEDKLVPGKYAFAEKNDPIGPQIPHRSDWTVIGKRYGRFVLDIIEEKFGTYGVEVLTKHPVVDVEVKDGKIVAAIAKSDAGYVRVACKACIMAIGSWIHNETVLKKYTPKFAAVKPLLGTGGHLNSNYTGDGIALAEKVGAFLDYDSFCLRLMGPVTMGAKGKVFSAMAQSPYIMSVNLDGDRYCSEPVGHMTIFEAGHVQLDQPKSLSYNIFDQNTLAAALELQKCIQTGKCADSRTALIPGRYSNLPDTMEEITKDLEENTAEKSDIMFRADTPEELADKIGVNKRNFVETLRAYNESCEKGIDLQFFKPKEGLVPLNKPPFYASRCTVGTDGAFGGVLVNPDMQAYKSDRNGLVEGLYVTGDFASGRHINLGGVKRQVINDISWAFSSGFLAGTNAGKYLKSL